MIQWTSGVGIEQKHPTRSISVYRNQPPIPHKPSDSLGRRLRLQLRLRNTDGHFSLGHYKDTARQAGIAAARSEAEKCQNCHHLKSNYNIQPVAVETTDVYGQSTAPFFICLTKKLVDMSNDPRECQWLKQRLCLAVVRGNAVSILACVQV